MYDRQRADDHTKMLIHKRVQELQAQKQDEQVRQDSRKEAIKAILDVDTLTTELAELLIDRVLVYPDKRIEIAYKIQDIFV